MIEATHTPEAPWYIVPADDKRRAQRLHPNVLAAAPANKLARIAWTVLAQERSYEARVTKATA